MSKKSSLHEVIRTILLDDPVGSQHDLREKLNRRGFEATQSTISRALKRLGATRVYNQNKQAIYELPSSETHPPVDARLVDLVVSIRSNGNVIVIKTKPGAAAVMARHIDASVPSIIGTVAGNDCFLAIPNNSNMIENIQDDIKRSLRGED